MLTKNDDDYYVETLNDNMGYFFKVKEKILQKKTKFQNLEILETYDFGRVLRLDGIFQTSEKDEFLYHEPLAHVAGIAMNGPRSALVIGGGDGGAIEELLKYNTLKEIVMVELDEEVVHTCKEYLPSISNGAFQSEKLDLRFEDGIEYIKNCNKKFDQILLDLTDPMGASLSLYTQEFYHSINNILNENGALSLHIESPISQPKTFAKIFWTLKSIFKEVYPMLNYVPMYGTLWGYAVASQNLNLMNLTKESIDERIEKLELRGLSYYNAETHNALLALPSYVLDILDSRHDPITMKTKQVLSYNQGKPLFIKS